MKLSVTGPLLSLAALASAQGAQAQQNCVEAADLSDTVTYAMPILYDSLGTSCDARFSKSEFMRTRAADFVDEFRSRQDAAWPGTLRLMKTFMASKAAKSGSGDDEMAALIGAMPDESLRPFVDAMVGQMINQKIASTIKPNTCDDIAEAMELLAPLPPENIAGLFTFILRQSDIEDPALCPSG